MARTAAAAAVLSVRRRWGQPRAGPACPRQPARWATSGLRTCLTTDTDNSTGRKALHSLAQSDVGGGTMRRLTDALLAHPGIDEILDVKDAHGDTPLHHAVYAGSVPCAQLLAEAGADRTAKNEMNKSPVDLALDPALAARSAATTRALHALLVLPAAKEGGKGDTALDEYGNAAKEPPTGD